MVDNMRRWLLNAMLGLVVALLGAVPLAQATGLDRERYGSTFSPMEFTCGLILFVLTLTLVGPTLRGLGGLVSALARSESRPSQAAALGLLASGTFCVLGSLYMAWAHRAVNPAVEVARQMQESMRNLNVPNAPAMNFNFSTPFDPNHAVAVGSGAMILTVLTFALGVGLIALGVWAVLPPSARLAGHAANGHAEKGAPIPAADATSL